MLLVYLRLNERFKQYQHEKKTTRQQQRQKRQRQRQGQHLPMKSPTSCQERRKRGVMPSKSHVITFEQSQFNIKKKTAMTRAMKTYATAMQTAFILMR